MYFSKEGKSTLIEISARFSKLYLNSFKSWGNGKAILESERSDLAAIIKKVYLLAYKEDLEIVHWFPTHPQVCDLWQGGFVTHDPKDD